MIANPVTKTIDQSLHIKGSGLWLKAFYILSAVVVAAVLAFNIFKPIIVLPRVSLAPGFVFTNQDGVVKTSEDYRGRLTLYNFTYSQCAAGCPQTTLQMQSLRNALASLTGQDAKFALVTISLDPEHDTPNVMNQYAARFLTNAPRDISWDFLTGDPTRTRYVVGGGFGLYYQNNSSSGDAAAVTFQPRYVLVDGWGVVRAEYRTAELDISRVLRDVGYLESEIRNSQGVVRYAYEAAHLFRCFP